MKVAISIESDASILELQAGKGASDRVSASKHDIDFKVGKSYSVYAVEFVSGCPHAIFWVVGEQFSQRCADGIVRPDMLTANQCKIVDSAVPKHWLLAITQFGKDTRTILGPPSFLERGFFERLTDNDADATKTFLKALADNDSQIALAC